MGHSLALPCPLLILAVGVVGWGAPRCRIRLCQSVEMKLQWAGLALEWKVREDGSCAKVRARGTETEGELCSRRPRGGAAGTQEHGPQECGDSCV